MLSKMADSIVSEPVLPECPLWAAMLFSALASDANDVHLPVSRRPFLLHRCLDLQGLSQPDKALTLLPIF